MTFTCSVIPCNEIGSMVLWYGHVQKLFSGICNETFYITDRRFEFSCNSAECMYSLDVYDVDITDHKRSMFCIYRSSSEDMLIKTTSIGVLGKYLNTTFWIFLRIRKKIWIKLVLFIRFIGLCRFVNC